MVLLVFLGPNRKIITFSINGRTVIYFDEVWKNGIQIYPKDNLILSKLRRGNPTFKVMAALIMDANKGENLKEYEACKTEEEIAEIIRKDCKNKGLVEIK